MIYKFIILGIYKHLLSDRKFGLTHNLIATKVMPPLVPQTVNPGLNMEQVYNLKKKHCKRPYVKRCKTIIAIFIPYIAIKYRDLF
jgi:hypothetical protein